MRLRDWYFQGWERRPGADGKVVLVYTGEYYSFPEGLRAVRGRALPLAAALTALYLAVALLPSPGGMWHYAAIPQLLELIPLIYLVLGSVCLLRAKEPMTYREYYSSWRRMRFSALWSVGFTACMAAVEAAYLIRMALGALLTESPAVPSELLYLLGEAVCVVLSLLLYRYIQHHPCSPSVQRAEKE